MPSAPICATCGSSLPAEAPEGLCPKCLLQAGLGASEDPTVDFLDRSGTKIPDQTEADEEAPSGSTISWSPFRVRYFGDYELRGEIARGGMGVVYRARQVSLDRPVALKMILPNRLDEDGVKRLYQEAESAGNLDHPNIVQVYEVGRHAGQHFLSMKLIDGRSLKDELSNLRKDHRAGARLIVTVARAVHHAHQRGVLHRDLKPHNILIDRNGQPYVTDFGLAKRVDAGREVAQTGAWAGTPEYMPPEQADGEFKGLTTAADIYSLGATLYAVLTGGAPFQGSRPSIYQRIIHDDPARPSALDPRVDADLDTICLKSLEKDPDRRYPTAAELADDLDRWLRGEPITARPVSPWERVRKWVRRKPAIAALSAAVLVIALLGLTGIFWQWRAAVSSERAAIAARDELSKANFGLKAARDEAERRRNEIGKVNVDLIAARDEAERQRQAVLKANIGLVGALRQARQNAYAAHINLAQREWDNTNVRNARELLETPDEAEFRGFEWYYLKRLYFPEILNLKGHAKRVAAVSFSPDGERLASASWDQTVKLWDAAAGQELRTLQGHTSGVSGVSFSPDGERLASASADKTVKIWLGEGRKNELAREGIVPPSTR